MNRNIGEKMKRLRVSQNKKLRDIAEATELSISYLSQVERGLSSPSLYSLERISYALGVKKSYFMESQPAHDSCLMRNYQHTCTYLEGSPYYYNRLGNESPGYILEPVEVSVLPFNEKKPSEAQPHKGEEFIYVLEGVLTVLLGAERYDLNPGDSMHYMASIPHDWRNYSGRVVRLLSVNTPPPWSEDKDGR